MDGKELEQHLRNISMESTGVQKHSLLQLVRVCHEKLEQELGGAPTDRNANLVRQMREERG